MSLPLVQSYSQKAQAVKEYGEPEAAKLLFSLELIFFKRNILCLAISLRKADILQRKTATNLRLGGIIFTKNVQRVMQRGLWRTEKPFSFFFLPRES